MFNGIKTYKIAQKKIKNRNYEHNGKQRIDCKVYAKYYY
jgi:hypothetical protein